MASCRPAHDVEQEVAFRLFGLSRNEFGLTPADASATLDERILRVRMQDALTPMARVVGRSPDGSRILESVYAVLLDASRERMHQLITRVIGRPVWRSEIRVDISRGDVSFVFELAARPDLR